MDGFRHAHDALLASSDTDRFAADLLMSADSALARMKAGNARFVVGTPIHPGQTTNRRAELAGGQHPFALVLSCADSRVPPELVFDQGLGDLFVVRSAGQVVDRAVLGSIQYAVAVLKTPLLVVLGHQRCGAVEATVDAVANRVASSGTDVDALVAAIRPAVEAAAEDGSGDLLDASVGKNVDRVVAQLQAAEVLARAVESSELTVVGAVYDLASGTVEFAERASGTERREPSWRSRHGGPPGEGSGNAPTRMPSPRR
jgi:carbonic anhydrase